MSDTSSDIKKALVASTAQQKKMSLVGQQSFKESMAKQTLEMAKRNQAAFQNMKSIQQFNEMVAASTAPVVTAPVEPVATPVELTPLEEYEQKGKALQEDLARALKTVDRNINGSPVKDTAQDLTVDLAQGISNLALKTGYVGLDTVASAINLPVQALTGGTVVPTTQPDDIIPSFTLEGGININPLEYGRQNNFYPRFDQLDKDIDQALNTERALEAGAIAEAKASERAANAAAKRKAIATASNLPLNSINTLDKIFIQGESAAQAVVDTWNNPKELMTVISESLPEFIGPGLVGSAAKNTLKKSMVPDAAGKLSAEQIAKLDKVSEKTGIAVGSLQEGISNSLSSQEQVMGLSEEELQKSSYYLDLLDQGFTPQQAKVALANKAMNLTFLASLGVSAAASKFTGSGKIEGSGFGLLDEGKEAVAASFSKKLREASGEILDAGLRETAQEAIESAGGQAAQNYAASKTTNTEQDLFEGTGDALGQGALVGGLVGTGLKTVQQAAPVAKEGKKAAIETAKKVSESLESEEYKATKAKEAKSAALTEEANKALSENKLDEFVASTTATAKEKLEVVMESGVLTNEANNEDKHQKVTQLATKLLGKTMEDGFAELDKMLKEAEALPEDTIEKKKALEAHAEKLKELESFGNGVISKIKILQKVKSSDLPTKDYVLKTINENKDSPEAEEWNKLYRNLGSSNEEFSEEDLNEIAKTDASTASFISDKQEIEEAISNEMELVRKESGDVHNDLNYGSKDFRSIKHSYEKIKEGIKTNNQNMIKLSFNRLLELKERNEQLINNYAPKGKPSFKQEAYISQLRAENQLINKMIKVSEKMINPTKQAYVVSDKYQSAAVESKPTTVKQSAVAAPIVKPTPVQVAEEAKTPSVETVTEETKVSEVKTEKQKYVLNNRDDLILFKLRNAQKEAESLFDKVDAKYSKGQATESEVAKAEDELIDVISRLNRHTEKMEIFGEEVGSADYYEAIDRHIQDASDKAKANGDLFNSQVEIEEDSKPDEQVKTYPEKSEFVRGTKNKILRNLIHLRDIYNEAVNNRMSTEADMNMTAEKYKEKSEKTQKALISAENNLVSFVKENYPDDWENILSDLNKFIQDKIDTENATSDMFDEIMNEVVEPTPQNIASSKHRIKEAIEPSNAFIWITRFLTKLGSIGKKFVQKQELSKLAINETLFNEIKKELTLPEEARVRLAKYSDEQISALENAMWFINKLNKTMANKVKLQSKVNDINEQFTNEAEYNALLDLTYFDEAKQEYVLDEQVSTAISVAVLQWIITSPEAYSLIATKKQVNGILNRNEKDALDPNTYLALNQVGFLSNSIQDTIGLAALNLLSIAPNKKEVNKAYWAKLQRNIGTLATYALSDMGHYDLYSMKTSVLLSFNNTKEKVAESDKAYTQFIKVKPEMADAIEGLSKDFRKHSEMFDELFGTSLEQNWPLTEPQEWTDKVSNSKQKAPKKVADKVKKHADRPQEVSDAGVLFSKLPADVQEAIAGISTNEDLADKHISEKENKMASDKAKLREIENFNNRFEKLVAAPFYFGHDIWVNLRLGMTGLINPQASKLHRWLVRDAEFATTVDTPEKMMMFKSAVIAGFDGKLDVWSNDKIDEEFAAILFNPTVRAAVKAINKIGLEELNQDDYDAIKAGVKATKTNAHGYAALVALGAYNPTGGFKTDLALEVDGKTNGFAISLMQYLGGSSPKELSILLARAGIGSYANLSDFFNETGETDNYYSLGGKWNSMLPDLMTNFKDNIKLFDWLNARGLVKQINDKNVISWDAAKKVRQALTYYVGSFMDENGSLKKIVRDLSKNPVMVSTYNAGITSIIETLNEELLLKFYKDIAEAANTNNTAKLAHMSKYMSFVTGTRVVITKKNALTFVFNDAQTEAIKTGVASLYGTALQKAMDIEYDSLKYRKNKIVDQMVHMEEVYQQMYDALAQKLMKKYNLNYLPENLAEYIHKKLNPIGLLIKSPLSESTDGTDWIDFRRLDAVEESQFKKETETNPKQNKNTVANLKAKGKESLSKMVFTRETSMNLLDDSLTKSYLKTVKTSQSDLTLKDYSKYTMRMKTAGTVALTHSSDAATIVDLYGEAIYGVHDAKISGIANALELTNKFNKSFLNTMTNYSMHVAVLEASEKMQKGLQKLIDNKEQFVTEFNVDAAAFDKTLSKLASELIAQTKEFERETTEVNTKRAAFINTISYVNQYTMNGGAYVNTNPVEYDPESRSFVAKKFDDAIAQEEENEIEEAEAYAKEYDLNESSDFGSSSDKIHVFKEISRQTIDSQDMLLNTLDALHKSDLAPTTDSHYLHLNKVMSVLGEALKPVVLRLGQAKDKTLGDYTEKTRTVRIALRGSVGSLLKGISNAEVYAHEMLHHLLVDHLDKKNVYTDRLRYLHELAEAYITPEDLIELDANGEKIKNPTPEQIQAGQDTWNYIFRNTEIKQEKRYNPMTGIQETLISNNGFHEFVTHAATNLQLINALKNNKKLNQEFKKAKKIEFAKSNAKSSNIIKAFDFIAELINTVISYIYEIHNRILGISDLQADEAVIALLKRTMNTQVNQSSKLTRLAQKFSVANEKFRKNGNSKITGAVGKGIQGVGKLIPSMHGTKNLKSALVDIGEAVENMKDADPKAVSKVMDNLISRIKTKETSLIKKLLREMQGNNEKTSYVYRLRLITNRFVDAMRINTKQDIKVFVNGLFNNELTKGEKQAFYYGVLRSNLQSLASTYTVDTIRDLTAKKQNLFNEIAKIENTLVEEYPKNGMYYIRHADSLANYMLTNKHKLRASGNNAYLIANLFTAQGYGKVENDVVKAERLISQMATLTALTKIDDAHLKILHKHLTDNPNSMINLMNIHRKSIEFSKENNFDNNPIQMKEGYVTDVTHPDRSIVFAYDYELNDLLAKGYKKVYDKPIPKDDLDQNTTLMYVLVNETASSAPLQGGAISQTSEAHRGMSLKDIRYENNEFNEDKKRQYYEARMDKRGYDYDVQSEIVKQFRNDYAYTEGNIANPIYDAQGKVVDYRYEMIHDTQVSALQLHDYFDEALGTTFAHSKDKINTKIINRIIIDEMFKDVQKYKNTKEFSEYVIIGAGSNNEQYKQMWYALPYDIREYAKEVFGDEGIMVRERLIEDLMGQREMRIEEVAKNLKDRINNRLTEKFYEVSKTASFKKKEAIFLEIMSMARDALLIKSGLNGLFNFSSNILLTAMKTGQPITSTLNVLRAYSLTSKYMNLVHKGEQLKLKLDNDATLSPVEKQEALAKYLRIEEEIRTNPVDALMKMGVFQTVVEDLDPENEAYSYATEFEKYVDSKTKKIPDTIKDLFKVVLMTHDTKLYKLMFKFVQFGDFAGRYALYEYNRKQGMKPEQNLKDIMETFVDYDPTTHRAVAMLNKYNLLVFTKYPLRIQKVLTKLAMEKPLNVLMLMAAQVGVGDMEDPYEVFAFADGVVTNRITDPASFAVDSLTSNVIMQMAP